MEKKDLTFSDIENIQNKKDWWQKELNEVTTCYKIPMYNIPSNFSHIKFKRKPKNCLDIGANVGTFSYHASNFFKNVFSYEAVGNTYLTAKENLEGKKNVKLNNLAVFSKSGEKIKIYKHKSELSGDSSIYEQADSTGDYETVNTTCLQDIISENNIDYVDYMKVDCEGAEYDFLMFQDLSKVLFLTMELHPGFIGEEKSSELLEYLEKYFVLEFMVGPHIYFYSKKGMLNAS